MFDSWRPNSDSELPLYAQLADFIRTGIKSGDLKDGLRLPGRETLTLRLGVSKSTLTYAMEILKQEGLIKSYPKSGYVVQYGGGIQRKIDWPKYISMAKHKVSTQEFKYYKGAVTDFSLSSDFRAEKYYSKAIVNAQRRMNGSKIPELTKYGVTSLRVSVQEYLKKFGIYADLSNIFITSEDVQRLYFVYESLMTSGSGFLYEETNIINTTSNIHSLGVQMVPVKMDKYGMLPSDLERHLVKYRYPVIWIDPTDQSPTGIVMSKKRRTAVIGLAQKYMAPIIEIDHSANIWHDNSRINPIKSLDTADGVIFLGSIIKCYPFDVQISWVVADSYLISWLSDTFAQSGIKANYFIQLVADEMLRSGSIYELTRDVKKFVSERRNKALELCNKYLKGKAAWNEDNCWFYFWLNFEEFSVRKAFKKFHIYDEIYPGYFFNKKDDSHALLCPASLKEDGLKAAVKRMARMFERQC